ncbi:MAG: winged helix-turn-helix transcriptional regulator [Schleiferiaceae bacterium]|jgi:Lrp/AsnC family transcriptional regulator for asnA, asnC and gidA|nr:winged helix-turn-helix transcriptional regulator [Schleiferiaceae bacterium]MDG1903355.1 winged helix-turn-helix transcriptional regulator [Schleiferiaceae bacterium]
MKIDKLDKQILEYLVKDARKPFTEIAKDLLVSPGTIHVRVKKMEQMGIIKSTSISVDYEKLGFGFIAYIGLYTSRSSTSPQIIDALGRVPEVTVAHLATGKYGIFCKIRCRDASHAKDVIFRINDIEGVENTESMISLEESINSNTGLLKLIIEDGK